MCSLTIKMKCHTAIPFNEELLQNVCISLSNLQTIVDHIINSRTVSDFNELVWALKALTLTDLTTLAGDDTKANVTRLCQRAAYPIADMDNLVEAGLQEKVHTAAVCVYPARVSDALEALRAIKKESIIQIAAVATGFPTGQYSLKTRLQEIEYAIESGATEIDVVINRTLALEEKWEELYDEIKKMRLACSDKAHLKTILAIGELGTMDNKLLSEVKGNWPSSGKGRPSVNAQTALYVTLWGLSNQNSLRKISQRFSLSIGLIHNTIMKTCKILAGLTTKYILWPKEEELNTLTNGFRQLCQPTGFPSVIGCVGVAHIMISSAVDNYYNSKGYSSIILQVYKASMVAMMAGSDFIKTSTGKEAVNATLPVGLVMIHAIQDFKAKTGRNIGLKPAGGVRTTRDAINWMILVKETLGTEWLTPNLFRFGASGLLDDILKTLGV